MSNGKVMIIDLIAGFIKKTFYKKYSVLSETI